MNNSVVNKFESVRYLGFTLVELSIVLVIIGLIVGGIVGGKSLIQGAKINGVIQDITKFKTAVNVFELQYDALPGDFSEGFDYWDDGTDDVCGGDTIDQYGCNGNGNGKIGDDGYQGMAETGRFWVHLQLAGMLSGITAYDYTVGGWVHVRDVVTASGVASRAGGNGYTVPLSDIKKGVGYVVVNPTQLSNWTPKKFYGRVGSWIMLSSPPDSRAQTVPSEFGETVTPAIAASIDKKMDDGLPTMGDVTGARRWSSSLGECTSPRVRPYEMDTTAPSSSIAYAVSESNATCNPMFYLGGN